MGLLSDTLEDNRELEAKIETVEYVLVKPPPAPPPKVSCPVCDRVFGSDLSLNNHIPKTTAQSTSTSRQMAVSSVARKSFVRRCFNAT